MLQGSAVERSELESEVEEVGFSPKLHASARNDILPIYVPVSKGVEDDADDGEELDHCKTGRMPRRLSGTTGKAVVFEWMFDHVHHLHHSACPAFTAAGKARSADVCASSKAVAKLRVVAGVGPAGNNAGRS